MRLPALPSNLAAPRRRRTRQRSWLASLALPGRDGSRPHPGIAFSRPTLGGPKLSLPKLGGGRRSGSRPTLGGPKLSLPKVSRPKLGAPNVSLPKVSLPKPQRKSGRARPQISLKRPSLSLASLDIATLLRGGGGAGANLVGLDIQPGFVAAVQARVNGSIAVERAAAVSLPADTVRDGEVMDEDLLGEALKELFARSGMPRRVRVGVANQRTVLRTLELPPITDPKELAAAVTFQAQDQVPMPLNNAVLDFQSLGIIDTPSGPRQRVVVVAAQKDMIERLLSAVRRAGLRPEGVDLSAFALIRALHRHDPEAERVLYLNVDGLTNLAIADRTICRFTRVVGSGLEGMAVAVAERRGIALDEARPLVAAVDLNTPPTQLHPVQPVTVRRPDESSPGAGAATDEPGAFPADEVELAAQQGLRTGPDEASVGDPERPPVHEEDTGFLETLAGHLVSPATGDSRDDVAFDTWNIVDAGIRDIAGEVRNSLDFHRSMDGGGEVSHVVMSGAADDIPGFAEALELALGVPVRSQSVTIVSGQIAERVSPHRLAVAAGLATAEAPQ
jgi:type IV pilus assembly protein PilM